MFSKRLLLLLAMLIVAAHLCFAHPMGNFSVNHYSKITLQQDGIQVKYFIDLAEIPTYQELQQYNITPEDASGIARYLVQRGNELANNLILRVDGRSLPLHMVRKAVIFPPGAGGLPTMKLGYTFHAAYPHVDGTGTRAVTYADNNYPGHAGWKEIIVNGPSFLLLASSAPKTDRSAELSNYPTDMLNSPPQDVTATLRISIPSATPVDAAGHAGTAVSPPMRRVDAAKPIAVAPREQVPAPLRRHNRAHPHSTPTPVHVAAVSLTSAQPVPAQPMHLQANRQRTARNRFTELITTQRMSVWFLLTAAFISMGLGSLHALEPGHGKTIVAAYLVGSRGTARHALLLGLIVTAAHTASVFALGAITLYASRYILPEQLYPWLGVMSGITIAVLGGYMFLRRWTGEETEHAHTAGDMHGHWFSSRKKGPEAGVTASTVGKGKSVSLAQLFTLGITGGIIPCPAALVVLLSALALHRVNFGLFLIVCFSLGLAAVLIGFGLLMVYARRFMSRLQIDGPWTKRWLPVASAGFMTILGTAIAIRGFATTGLTAHSFSQQKLGPALFIAGIGLVLGIRHSTDTDHVVAISTIVTKQRGLRGAALIGGLWGLGHTLTIFVVGCLIILCGVIIPPRVGLSMEFSVGLMLILLGLLNLSGLMQKIVVRFRQSSSSSVGTVLTYLAPEIESNDTSSSPVRNTMIRSYGAYQCLRPLAIGLVHGLAGSAAVALLVLSTIHKPLWAIVYLVIFGTGTMLGMMCMTMAMSMPLMYAGERMPRFSRYLSTASGIVSVCFGTFLVYQLGFVGGLFTSHPHWTPQ
jgi:ABC-type nickel/cobalt efflux system permease component RcnA